MGGRRWRAATLAAMTDRPFVTDDDEDRPVCGICPSKRLPRDQFVIYDRPTREAPFNPDDGFRYASADGVPVCVHPHKIGCEPDRIAPAPAPQPLDVPAPTPRRKRWWTFGLGR